MTAIVGQLASANLLFCSVLTVYTRRLVRVVSFVVRIITDKQCVICTIGDS